VVDRTPVLHSAVKPFVKRLLDGLLVIFAKLVKLRPDVGKRTFGYMLGSSTHAIPQIIAKSFLLLGKDIVDTLR
jgi:hypothetical protein